ncbi:hypothetical protein D3C84_979690 [compost metagenome]
MNKRLHNVGQTGILVPIPFQNVEYGNITKQLSFFANDDQGIDPMPLHELDSSCHPAFRGSRNRIDRHNVIDD